MNRSDRDIIAFHWPLLALLAFVLLVSSDLINTNTWAIFFLGLILFCMVPAYIYAAIRIHKFEPSSLKRFAWLALFLGAWPVGGPICYWVWFRNASSR
jgi:hypothetical protein